MKLGKQNQYIITDKWGSKNITNTMIYKDFVWSDISKLKVLKTLFKIVPARVWTSGSVADVTGLTQGVQI